MSWFDSGESARMISNLLVGELKSVSGRNDHHPFMRADHFAFNELAQRRQRNAGVRTVEHSGAVGARGFFGKLRLGSLFDHALETLQGRNRLANTDGITDLNRAGKGLFGGDRLEALEIGQE